jgi:anti-sigma regulatory factor (Ser/Thr protein kinase)
VNIVAHAWDGIINVDLDTDTIFMRLTDNGPGIADIGQAMQRGFSTASPEVREMGFGAGMGLPNISANADIFEIRSEPGVGTTLEITINLNSTAV